MGRSVRVLVAEDDENKRWLLTHYLAKTIPQAECVPCGSGAEAIAYLQQHAVDAVVTDHRMSPVNGIELIKWVRQHYAAIPIALVTGHPSIEAEARAAGATLVVETQRFGEVGELLRPLLPQDAAAP